MHPWDSARIKPWLEAGEMSRNTGSPLSFRMSILSRIPNMGISSHCPTSSQVLLECTKNKNTNDRKKPLLVMNLLCILRSGLCGLGVLVFQALRTLEPEFLLPLEKLKQYSWEHDDSCSSQLGYWHWYWQTKYSFQHKNCQLPRLK